MAEWPSGQVEDAGGFAAHSATGPLGHWATARSAGILFISERPVWPMDQGYRVHGCEMARALAAMGVQVRIATLEPTRGDDVPNWLRAMLVDWPTGSAEDTRLFRQGWAGWAAPLRHRVAGHQGVDPAALSGLIPLVRTCSPAAVIALGQHGPMLLAGLREACPGVARVWYAADELTYLQLSCLRREPVRAWPRRLRMLGVYLLLERLFGPRLHAAVGASPLDTRLLRHVAGVPATTIRNGVDLQRFAPHFNAGSERSEGPDQKTCDPRPPDPALREALRTGVEHASSLHRSTPGIPSLVFWGRLDFEPNEDAVCWFAARVWPELRRRWPDAVWRIVGKGAGERVRRLDAAPGIEVVGEVADVRPWARSAAATVLPMRCGGGIKNKLLEAAAMGRPIVASPRAVRGLAEPGVLVCRSAGQWVAAVERVWSDPAFAAELGRSARAWVEQEHAWPAAAERMMGVVEGGRKSKVPSPTSQVGEGRGGYAFP